MDFRMYSSTIDRPIDWLKSEMKFTLRAYHSKTSQYGHFDTISISHSLTSNIHSSEKKIS